MSKRQDLSSKQKCELLKSYDVLPKISLRDAAARLNVSHSTLNRYRADEIGFEQHYSYENIAKKQTSIHTYFKSI